MFIQVEALHTPHARFGNGDDDDQREETERLLTLFSFVEGRRPRIPLSAPSAVQQGFAQSILKNIYFSLY